MIRTVRKRTVLALLVEANGLVRLELSRALKREHFEVLWTATTEEAMAAYNRRHIDLLLLDLNQPVKVGWDIFEPMAALNPALPIVMVTEKKTELEQAVAERVGIRLEKPFSLLALIQTIHLLLGEQGKPICKRPAANPARTIFARPEGPQARQLLSGERDKRLKGIKPMKQKVLLLGADNEPLHTLRHPLLSETYEVVLAESLQQAIPKSPAGKIGLLSNLDSPTEEEGWAAIEQSRKKIR